MIDYFKTKESRIIAELLHAYSWAYCYFVWDNSVLMDHDGFCQVRPAFHLGGPDSCVERSRLMRDTWFCPFLRPLLFAPRCRNVSVYLLRNQVRLVYSAPFVPASTFKPGPLSSNPEC